MINFTCWNLKKNVCTQDIGESILLMNNHLRKDEPQRILFKPTKPWNTVDAETNPCIVEQSNNIKLSRSQYKAICIIKYGSMCWKFVCLQTFAYKFYLELVNVINSRPHINPQGNSNAKCRYGNMVLIIRQICRQHQNLNMYGITLLNIPLWQMPQCHEEGGEFFFIVYDFSFGSMEGQDIKKSNEKHCHLYTK